MQEAKAEGEKVMLERLEREIDKRALAGKTDPGSPNLLMFRTKRLDPRYRDNATVQVIAAGPLAISIGREEPQIEASIDGSEES